MEAAMRPSLPPATIALWIFLTSVEVEGEDVAQPDVDDVCTEFARIIRCMPFPPGCGAFDIASVTLVDMKTATVARAIFLII